MSGATAKVWVIDARDNAGTVTGSDIEAAKQVPIVGGASGTLDVRQPVPYGHKVALADLPAGTDVIKYGVVIGRVSAAVRKGEHLHVHNLESLRGRGDLADTGGAAR